jgi:hypothetical protein
MAGFGLAFVREFGERAKNEESEAYGELQEVLKDTKRDPLGVRRTRRVVTSWASSDE